MIYLLYLAGFIIGAAIFLYILSIYESGKEKLKSAVRGKSGEGAGPARVSPESIFHKKWKAHPGQRICPLCGSVLANFEALYAEPVKGEKGPRILILGCRYCYKTGDEEKARE
jgi:hypothetical protein